MSDSTLNRVSIRLSSGGHAFSQSDLERAEAAKEGVEVVVVTERVALVPEKFLDEAPLEEHLLAMRIPLSPADRVVRSVPREGIVAVMAVEDSVLRVLEAKNAVPITFTSPLLESIADGDGITIELVDDVAFITLHEGVLRFAEAQRVESDADLLYFIECVHRTYDVYNMYARAKGDTQRIECVTKGRFKNFKTL